MSSEGPRASTKASKRCRRQEQTAARQMNGRVMCRFACSKAERYLTCRHQDQTCQHYSCSCACASRARSGKTHKHSHSRISPVGKNSTPCRYQQRGAQSQQKDAMRPVAAAVPHWSTTACRRNAAVAAAAAASAAAAATAVAAGIPRVCSRGRTRIRRRRGEGSGRLASLLSNQGSSLWLPLPHVALAARRGNGSGQRLSGPGRRHKGVLGDQREVPDARGHG
mmetsp:Transcript_2238/g.5584  ORF Transcript_2238/g.5584 Transcript_2238/m.5584 type:complete len:223 (-) Transcript_2238:458-1126(-)